MQLALPCEGRSTGSDPRQVLHGRSGVCSKRVAGRLELIEVLGCLNDADRGSSNTAQAWRHTFLAPMVVGQCDGLIFLTPRGVE